MNDHDWLKEAAGASRDEHQGEPPPGVDTRARILATLHQRDRQRRRWVSFAVPLAAVFLFSSAWAASTGRLPRILALVPLPFSPAPLPTLPPEPPRLSASSPSPSPSAVDVDVPGSTAAAGASASASAPAASAASAPAAGTAPPPAARPGEGGRGGEVSDEDRLYREAHHAHFVERNPARALAAWDAYLRAQKTGRFATEATYNRALTLLRLGRTAEARRALEPFAQGRFGSYRQEEARKLLDAL